MRSRSFRPRLRPQAQLLAIWLCALVVALGLTASAGHALPDNPSSFTNTPSAPTGGSEGGDPDGIGLESPIPPGGGGPPFAPDPPTGDEGRSLGPGSIRLWILQVLFEIAI
jgi:hypothetical protein